MLIGNGLLNKQLARPVGCRPLASAGPVVMTAMRKTASTA
jgi:hypothetical protein